jgi:hypothetical protein
VATFGLTATEVGVVPATGAAAGTELAEVEAVTVEAEGALSYLLLAIEPGGLVSAHPANLLSQDRCDKASRNGQHQYSMSPGRPPIPDEADRSSET